MVGIAGPGAVAPEAQGVVQDFAPADGGLYVANLLGGPSELRSITSILPPSTFS